MRYLKTHKIFLESLYDELGDKLDKYKDVKQYLIDIIEKQIPDLSKESLLSFIDLYIEGKKTIEGLVNDSDIYDFYLKYTNDIDEILSDINFYEKDPSEIDSFGLYDYMVKGSKISIKEFLKSISGDISTSTNESFLSIFKKKDINSGRIVAVDSIVKDRYNKYPTFIYVILNKEENIFKSLLIGQIKNSNVVDLGYFEKKFIKEDISYNSDNKKTKCRDLTNKECDILFGYIDSNDIYRSKIEKSSKTKIKIP